MSSSHPVTKSYHWVGFPIREDANHIHYKTLQIKTNISSDTPLEVQIGDKVYLQSTTREPFIAEVVQLYESRKSATKKLKASWFYRPNEIDLDSTELVLHPHELFSSNHVDVNEISMIWGKCSVLFVPQEVVIPPTLRAKHLYFCRYYINREPKIWEVQIIHPSKLLEELKRYETVISDDHRRRIEGDKAFWNLFVTEVRKAFHNHANDPSLRIFFQYAVLSYHRMEETRPNLDLEPDYFHNEDTPTTTRVRHSLQPTINKINNVHPLVSTVPSFNRPTYPTDRRQLPIPPPSTATKTMSPPQPIPPQRHEIPSNSNPNPVSNATEAVNRMQSQAKPSVEQKPIPPAVMRTLIFNYKHLHVNLSDFELALDLFKQEQSFSDPSRDVSSITSDSFPTPQDREKLITKYLRFIYGFRYRERQKKVDAVLMQAVPPTVDAVIEATISDAVDAALNPIPVKPGCYLPQLFKPGPYLPHLLQPDVTSPLLLTTSSPASKATSLSNNASRKKRSYKRRVTVERQPEEQEELYFKNEEENHPRTPTGLWFPENQSSGAPSSSSFLQTNPEKIRRKYKKRKRSMPLTPPPVSLTTPSSARSLLRRDGDDAESESSTDPEEDYFEDEQAEIPPLRENIDPMEHRTILLQSGQQRFVYDFPFPTDYYEVLAYEEITRIKIDFVNSLPNKNKASRSNLSYGQSRLTVDGSLILFRGEIQEVILDALRQSDHSITAALKSLHQVVRPRLLVWTAEEQRIIHFHFYSKEARDLSKLRRQLKSTKTIKDILDYKSRFISGPRAFEAGYRTRSTSSAASKSSKAANGMISESEQRDKMATNGVEVEEGDLRSSSLVEVEKDWMEVSEVEIVATETNRFNTGDNSNGENNKSTDVNHRSHSISNDHENNNHSDEDENSVEEALELIQREAVADSPNRINNAEEAPDHDYYYFKEIDQEDEVMEYNDSEESSDDQQYFNHQTQGDLDYYWAPEENSNDNHNNSSSKPKRNKMKRLLRPRRSLRSNSFNVDYAKSVIASYIRETQEDNIREQFRDLFDDYSAYQYDCTIMVRSFLSPAEFRVRIIHLLHNAYYIPDPFRREKIALTTANMASYQETSQQKKQEFYNQFCLIYPLEVREDRKPPFPLFTSSISHLSMLSVDTLCNVAAATTSRTTVIDSERKINGFENRLETMKSAEPQEAQLFDSLLSGDTGYCSGNNTSNHEIYNHNSNSHYSNDTSKIAINEDSISGY